jgi:hypothetical protein
LVDLCPLFSSFPIPEKAGGSRGGVWKYQWVLRVALYLKENHRVYHFHIILDKRFS